VKGWVGIMTEKLYKKIKSTGALNLVIGIILIVFGIAFGVMLIVSGGKLLVLVIGIIIIVFGITSGVMLIVNGGRLLSHKSDTLF